MQNSLLNITGVSQLELSEVILQAKLQLTRIVWIVAGRADGCEGVGVGERQVSRLSEVWRVGQIEHLGTKLKGGLAECGNLPDDREIQTAEGRTCHLSRTAAKVGHCRRSRSRCRRISESSRVEKLRGIVATGVRIFSAYL